MTEIYMPYPYLAGAMFWALPKPRLDFRSYSFQI
uniref:Uncharacterized protein n=1 Tax=Rhizophora mucronata TaxID=61149 RepID=A0A2P2P438_RHIMU